MRVLLTNDDGVRAEGLRALRNALSQEHEVWTVAPHRERSGASHAVTLHDAVTISELSDREYDCSGTPADCVLYSVLGAIPFVPEVVVSGINHGPNLGTDLVYSGTAAAARQAALMNVPGVAVSLAAARGELEFDAAAEFVARHLDLLCELWDPDFFFNVNVPVLVREHAPVVTRPARRIYNDKLEGQAGKKGSTVFTLHGTINSAHIERGTDWAAVEEGKVSVSPVHLQPLNQTSKESYHSTQLAAFASNRKPE